jgi:hypothetical protein
VQREECFDLGEEGGFTGVVKAEEEDRVFWGNRCQREGIFLSAKGGRKGSTGFVPGLLVA